jgi:hypothetical protein
MGDLVGCKHGFEHKEHAICPTTFDGIDFFCISLGVGFGARKGILMELIMVVRFG